MMEHVINAKQATTVAAMAANPAADLINVSSVVLQFVLIGVVVVLDILVGGSDELVVVGKL